MQLSKLINSLKGVSSRLMRKEYTESDKNIVFSAVTFLCLR
ncbi:hypothetical protein [Candidatus Enterovibrio escicola]